MYKVFLCKESQELHMIYAESAELIEYEFNTEKYELLMYDRKRKCQSFMDNWQSENVLTY